MLSLVKDILGSAQMSVKNLDPRTCVILAENTEPPAYENVLRAYMAKTSTSTSLYQAWLKAKDNSEESFVYAGREFDTSDLFPNCRLTEIIDTPSTKKGVDVTQDPKYFIENGFVTEEEYEDTKFKSIMAFQLVSRMLRKKGIAFVDTKTEHGKNSKDETVGIDELYTMDSSRFWLLDENGDLLLENGEPIQIGKENARKMVTQKGQQFTKEQREQIAFDYIKGYQRLTGKRFVPDMRSRVERYRDGLKTLFENI
jgi:phosphoribosylaminoimidazole-succinocarboxamide synthase